MPEINITPNAATNIFQGVSRASAKQSLPTVEDINPPQNHNPMIVIAAPPKTASTYLSFVLKEITNIAQYRLCSSYFAEPDLNLASCYIAKEIGCIYQAHMCANWHNINLIKIFNMKVVLAKRNIYDQIVSLAKDIARNSKPDNLGEGNIYPFLWVTEGYDELPFVQQIDFVIDYALPWHYNYYKSWEHVINKKIINAKWIDYESLMNDKLNVIKDLLNFLELPLRLSDSDLAPILNEYYKSSPSDHGGKEKSNIGSGKDFLTKKQINKIDNLLPKNIFNN